MTRTQGWLLPIAIAAALAAPGCRAGSGPEAPAAPAGAPQGDCLAGVCLGGGSGLADEVCRRFTGAPPAPAIDVMLFGDAADRIVGVLASTHPICGPSATVVATPAPDVVDCRGVRLGDPAAFIAKMHRQARPIESGDDLWLDAPAGVERLADTCTPEAAAASRTAIYLQDGQVVGLGIGGPR